MEAAIVHGVNNAAVDQLDSMPIQFSDQPDER
jgi:hypothetical protein